MRTIKALVGTALVLASLGFSLSTAVGPAATNTHASAVQSAQYSSTGPDETPWG
jgi:hypothetical protein